MQMNLSTSNEIQVDMTFVNTTTGLQESTKSATIRRP
jgi:hypothetical protein